MECVGADSILEDDAGHVYAVVTEEPFDAVEVLRLAGLVELPEVFTAHISDAAVGKPHAAQEHVRVVYRLHGQSYNRHSAESVHLGNALARWLSLPDPVERGGIVAHDHRNPHGSEPDSHLIFYHHRSKVGLDSWSNNPGLCGLGRRVVEETVTAGDLVRSQMLISGAWSESPRDAPTRRLIWPQRSCSGLLPGRIRFQHKDEVRWGSLDEARLPLIDSIMDSYGHGGSGLRSAGDGLATDSPAQ